MNVSCEGCTGACDMAFNISSFSLTAMTRAAEGMPDAGQSLDFGAEGKAHITRELKGMLAQMGCGLTVEQVEYRLQQEAEAL